MDVRKIVAKYLEENGFDGLYNLDVECSCLLSELMVCIGICECITPDCKPGYRVPCTNDKCQCEGHIVPS